MKNIETYTHQEHLHRYAIWTAARAAQRGFTTTENIGQAIEKSDLRNFSETRNEMSTEEFGTWHENQCEVLSGFLNQIDKIKPDGTKDGKLNCSYGRAAKIIAIYLKTSVIIPHPDHSLSALIHPPIDAILISNLYKARKEIGFSKEFENFKWTKEEKEKYLKLIKHLRTLTNEPLWKLEYLWQVAK